MSQRLCDIFYIRALITFIREGFSWPNLLLKDPPLSTITLTIPKFWKHSNHSTNHPGKWHILSRHFVPKRREFSSYTKHTGAQRITFCWLLISLILKSSIKYKPLFYAPYCILNSYRIAFYSQIIGTGMIIPFLDRETKITWDCQFVPSICVWSQRDKAQKYLKKTTAPVLNE